MRGVLLYMHADSPGCYFSWEITTCTGRTRNRHRSQFDVKANSQTLPSKFHLAGNQPLVLNRQLSTENINYLNKWSHSFLESAAAVSEFWCLWCIIDTFIIQINCGNFIISNVYIRFCSITLRNIRLYDQYLEKDYWNI